MDLTNVQLSNQNSVTLNNSGKKNNYENVKGSSFDKVIKDSINSKDTKPRNYDKFDNKRETSEAKAEINNKSSLEKPKDVQKKDEESPVKEYSLENKERTTEKLEEDTLSDSNELQHEENDINQVGTEFLSLLSADLIQLVNNYKESEEQKNQLNELLQAIGSNEDTLKSTENKLSDLLVLLQKTEDGDLPKDLSQQILALVNKNLEEGIANQQNKNKVSLLGVLENQNTNSQLSDATSEKLTEDIFTSITGENGSAINKVGNSEEKSNFNHELKSILDKLKDYVNWKSDRAAENNQKEALQGITKLQDNKYEENSSKIGVQAQGIHGNDIASKENSILKKFIEGDKSESKISRAANFAHIINDNRLNFSTVENENKIPVYISKGTFNEDIVKAIKFMDLNGVKDLSVKIYPKELGEVFISVTMEQGALKASIKATNKDAVDMLNLGLKDINEKLNLNNSKVQSVDIGLYSQDTTYFSNGNFNEQHQQQFRQANKGSNSEQSTKIEDDIPIKPSRDDSEINLLA